MTAGKLHNLDEGAALLGGRRPEYYRRLAKAGKIPARRIAGHWYFTDADLAEALEVFKNDFAPPVAAPALEDTVRPLAFTKTTARRIAS